MSSARRVVVFGGGSEIALAILTQLASRAPLSVTLAMRSDSASRAMAAQSAQLAGVSAAVVDFDATDFASHPGLIGQLFTEPVDVAIIAFGMLGEASMWADQPALVQLAQTNFVGALSVGSLVAERFRQQGSGQLIIISSMAGEKVRPANFPYGASKAGMDAFFSQLAAELAPQVQVLVVRPGKVRTKLLGDAKTDVLTVSPQRVAKSVVRALDAGKQLIRVPWIFGPLVTLYRHLPDAIRRRLNF